MTFETGVSIAGLFFMISLTGCGGPNPQALAQAANDALVANGGGAASNGGHGGGGGGGGHGKGGGGGGAQNNVVPCEVELCYVNPLNPADQADVCTDLSTAISKYGVDPSVPGSTSSSGSHLGSC
jgi:hypothetical protein